MADQFYVIFDGSPGPTSGHFIEVEAEVEGGPSLKAGEWIQRSDGLWALGPFIDAPDPQKAQHIAAATQTLRIAFAGHRGDSYCYPAVRAAKRLLEALDA